MSSTASTGSSPRNAPRWPDAIGHGESSKPSDALHARFPHYDYDDMVRAQYLLVHDGLQVDHLRLVMGAGMGGMHAWLWGERHPEFIDALMPLASAPVPIAGRQRFFRDVVIDSIRTDPEWKGGEYIGAPRGFLAAQYVQFLMTTSPAQLQQYLPGGDVADAQFQVLKKRFMRAADANDGAPDRSILRTALSGPYRHRDHADYHGGSCHDNRPEPLIAGIQRCGQGISQRQARKGPKPSGCYRTGDAIGNFRAFVQRRAS